MRRLIFTFGFCLLCLAGIFNVSVKANTEISDVKVEEVDVVDGQIRIGELYTDLGVPSEDVYITREVTDKETVVSVFDKESNEYLFGFTEENTNPNVRGTYLKKVSQTKSSGGAQATLEMQLECYSSSSFRQINKVVSTKWIANSGSFLTTEAKGYIVDKNSQGVGTKARMYGTATMKKGSNSNIAITIDHTYSLY